MELLAPAGSPAAVEAAVYHGADAVYLGFGQFNARRNAKNFSESELETAISLCHTYGVKVYLTLNTLLTDREFDAASISVRTASQLGVDAILIQDLGALQLVKQVAPDLPIHASTQMSIHNLEGIKQAAQLGVSRVVLARELPKEEIAFLCTHSPVEIEIFVHGALCMCYSGQCYFSSVIGGRSGNRGLCAQPCRLPYGWEKKANEYPLSLKDMSLINYLKELEEMGVACIKIEGRMKRPEYVSIVTSIYAKALKEGKEPTKSELSQLQSAFSRQGFTSGYYKDQCGPDMFGIRDEASKEAKLQIEGLTLRPPVSISGTASFSIGQPSTFTVQDQEGHKVTVSGPAPEPAKVREMTKGQISQQLKKTGGTPYVFSTLDVQTEDGLFLSASAINHLRRDAISILTEQRTLPPDRHHGIWAPKYSHQNRTGTPGLIFSVRNISQLTKNLMNLHPIQVYLPLEEAAIHPEKMTSFLKLGIPLAVSLPRVIWDREWKEVEQQLDVVQSLGIQTALVGNLGQIRPLQKRGFKLRGDFGLNVYNSQTLETLQTLSLSSATLSFELRFSQIRDISKCMDTEILVYGRLPLMITEQCIIHNRTGQCTCQKPNFLLDRTHALFPVVREPLCRNIILNAKPLFLADKQEAYENLGLWGARLSFTTETPEACIQIAKDYLEKKQQRPADFTRGLYYREVE